MSEQNVEKEGLSLASELLRQWREEAAPNPHARRGYRRRDARIITLLDALTATEQELRQRELHHFETEQIIARIESLLDGWEAAHSHLGIERSNWGPSSSNLRRALSIPPAVQNGDDHA